MNEELFVEIDKSGNKIWRDKKGYPHRSDGPAIEHPNGTKEWYQNGERHRLDGPAIEFPNGTKHWYQYGKCHRLDGPAVEHPNLDKAWYKNGRKFKNKDAFFSSLTKKQKEAALFSVDFLNG